MHTFEVIKNILKSNPRAIRYFFIIYFFRRGSAFGMSSETYSSFKMIFIRSPIGRRNYPTDSRAPCRPTPAEKINYFKDWMVKIFWEISRPFSFFLWILFCGDKIFVRFAPFLYPREMKDGRYLEKRVADESISRDFPFTGWLNALKCVLVFAP